ncbi:kynureninase [Segeticoccus rhizosphaerae]|uniref:kynureninase n=1 Tax=Segeticoccus rhizosphaerae TaxID=1104777 RepID=UPI0010C063BA|nr:kynureninase [Ornithinicoccus soli]
MDSSKGRPVEGTGARARAAALDAADPLAGFVDRFLPMGAAGPAGDLAAGHGAPVVAYLDGNSLGRPPREVAERMQDLITATWGSRLIRGWTDEWMTWPETVGDLVGGSVLGAAPGQTVVADSTTVMLYKLARAAVAARPGRHEIVLDTDNFPTDRYVLEGIAQERSLRLRWVETDPAEGIRPEQVAGAVGPDTALVVFSHVAYRSGWLADAEAITRIAHDAGALMLWDLCHSAGSVPVELDRWSVDLAVGCTYKYLNGGPGAPAFGYVAERLQGELQQPIWGWMGRRDPFEMGPGYRPAEGIRSVVSGTPPIMGMLPVRVGVELVAEAGIEAIRAKSVALTQFAIEIVDGWPNELGVEVASPRDPARRGSHVTLRRADFREVNEALWERGVIPDFREPDGIRIGLSPLSTTFAEVEQALAIMREVLESRPVATDSSSARAGAAGP